MHVVVPVGSYAQCCSGRLASTGCPSADYTLSFHFSSVTTLPLLQKEEEVNPTKKGLMMNAAEWAILEAALPDLRTALANKDMAFTVNMSEFRRATLFEKGCVSVDIREWYSTDDGGLKPGQKGVALSEESFQV